MFLAGRAPAVSDSVRAVALTLCLCLSVFNHAIGDPTVGVYYYPWWGEGISGGHTFNQTLRTHLTPELQLPAVGLYHSRDADVISAHIDQSHIGNISMWSLSWWGPGSFEDIAIRNHILPHERASEISYTIHYESSGRLGDAGNPDYTNLIPDFQYLAGNVFNNPNYMRIDGRPVVVMYLTRAYFDDQTGWNELNNLRSTMQQQYRYEPYIIGDHLFGTVATGAFQMDAITGFDVYGQEFGDGISDQNSINGLKQIYANAKWLANNQGVDFVPGVSPGYNDRVVRAGHPPAARYLQEMGSTSPGSVMEAMLEDAVLPYTDPNINELILVNSFNEWHEDTQIEASVIALPTNTDDSATGSELTAGRFYEGYGTRYLEILRSATSSEPPPGPRTLTWQAINSRTQIDLGAPDVVDNMTHLQVGDGDTTDISVGGRIVRRNVDPNEDFYFYFAVDDSFAFQGDQPELSITMDYFDSGTGTLALQYDSDTGDTLPAFYKVGDNVTLTGTGTWKQHTFQVNDAYFGNRQNHGADFRIVGGIGNPFYLDRLQVTSGQTDWFEATSWTPGGGPPNSANQTAVFGGLITGPTVATLTSDVTVNRVEFDNATHSYTISGSNSVNIDRGTKPGLPATGVFVSGGSHEFEVVTNIRSDATVDVGSNSTLTFNNALNLMGNTLTKMGVGTVVFHNDLVTGGGAVNVQQGTVSGKGTVSGNVHNSGGTIAPGSSPGQLTITGNYTQQAGATLEIEIGGTTQGEEYDLLEVLGDAWLAGTLAVSLINGFVPDSSDTFTVLTVAGELTDLGLVLGGPDAGLFSLNVDTASDLIMLTAVAVGLAGDYNDDGAVDAADYTIFRDNLGGNSSVLNGNGSGAATVVQADYNLWKQNFGNSGTGSGAAIPEPSTPLLLMTSLLGLARIKRKHAAWSFRFEVS